MQNALIVDREAVLKESGDVILSKAAIFAAIRRPEVSSYKRASDLVEFSQSLVRCTSMAATPSRCALPVHSSPYCPSPVSFQWRSRVR
jgi:hypothetical protein